jgi:mannose-1-phosphate guanylyltransferase
VPFLAYQLSLLRCHGISDVVLSCSYLVDEVRETMGDGSRYGVELRYAIETEPLGTAGGVRNAADLVAGRVVVLNGDILTDMDLTAMLAFHAERASAATIYLTRVEDPTQYGLVEVGDGGRVLRFLEKPDPAHVTTDTVNAGIYILDPALLARIPTGRMVSIEREFFPGLLRDRIPFHGWTGNGYWLDIGNAETYRRGQLDLLAGRVATGVAPAGAGTDRRWMAEGVRLADGVTVAAPAVVGRGSELGPDCRIGPSAVLGERCAVGRGATVEGSVLWERVTVGDGATLRDCVVGAGARIGASAELGAGAVVESGAEVPRGARLQG